MKTQKEFSIVGNRKSKSIVEKTAQVIFTICAFMAVMAVASITIYMIMKGTPALFEVGIKEILFGTVWKPSAKEPSFGILYVILTSIVGTTMAIIIGVPINSCIFSRGSTKKTGFYCKTGSRAACRYSICYLRIVRYFIIESTYV